MYVHIMVSISCDDLQANSIWQYVLNDAIFFSHSHMKKSAVGHMPILLSISTRNAMLIELPCLNDEKNVIFRFKTANDAIGAELTRYLNHLRMKLAIQK